MKKLCVIAFLEIYSTKARCHMAFRCVSYSHPGFQLRFYLTTINFWRVSAINSPIRAIRCAERRSCFSSERYRRSPQIAVVHRNVVIAGVVCPRGKIKAQRIREIRQRQPTIAGALFGNSACDSYRITGEGNNRSVTGGHFSVENRTAALR